MNVETSSERTRLQRKQLMHQAMLWLERFVEYGSIVCLFVKGGNSSRLQFGYYSCDGDNLWRMVKDEQVKGVRASKRASKMCQGPFLASKRCQGPFLGNR